ncbi:hypothetical protein K9M79_08065 [Candidatus Woesearchaeota archaeon]|nr:hypothetical protein [Candidatus Woesearchaeota archaeon]
MEAEKTIIRHYLNLKDYQFTENFKCGSSTIDFLAYNGEVLHLEVVCSITSNFLGSTVKSNTKQIKEIISNRFENEVISSRIKRYIKQRYNTTKYKKILVYGMPGTNVDSANLDIFNSHGINLIDIRSILEFLFDKMDNQTTEYRALQIMGNIYLSDPDIICKLIEKFNNKIKIKIIDQILANKSVKHDLKTRNLRQCMSQLNKKQKQSLIQYLSDEQSKKTKKKHKDLYYYLETKNS